MATMTLKSVPEELIDRLKREAASNRRSLNQEAIARLEQSLTVAPKDAATKVALIKAAQARFAHWPPLDDEFLQAAKRAGRE
jgi:plasmid stability protein